MRTLMLPLVLTLILTPNEAAEAFGVVSTRTFGSTKAARGLAALTLTLALSPNPNPNPNPNPKP